MLARRKTCRANVGTRNQPRFCDKSIANGMLAACKDHATTLIPTGESHIYYRGGRYVVVTEHRGKQQKSSHRSLGLAREARGDRTGTNKQPRGSRDPFDRYAIHWIDNYQGRTARGFDEDTRASFKRALELYAIPHFGRTPLRDIERESDISRASVNALVEKLRRKDLAPATISKYMAPVKALFNDAMDDGLLNGNPAARLIINAKARPANEPDKPERVKTMTRAQLAAVLGAIRGERERLLFDLLAQTGCRISEALGLDCPHVEDRGGRFTLTIEQQWYRGKLKRYTKSGNGMRTITLPPELGRRLWETCAVRTGPLFATRSGKRLSARNMSRVLKRAEGDAKLPHVSPHSFRHTHGSMLLDEGWPITDVADRLGDDVQTITKTYARKLRDRDRDVSFMDDLGNGAPAERKQRKRRRTSRRASVNGRSPGSRRPRSGRHRRS
jgi:integrase